MKADKAVAAYRRLREQPLWKLLAADNGPTILGLLQTHLLETERSLSASILHERIGRDLEELRARGDDLPQTAQAYIADWLTAGYLERRFPPGATEEEYQLAAATIGAIRLMSSLLDRRVAATESRLALVLQQLVRLAEETDPNPQTRAAALRAERDRLDRQIEAVEEGRSPPITEARALERAREIISLSAELVADFHRVRDDFEHLNRGLRERLLDTDAKRGEVLDALFAGVDVIAESEAGRTFSGFWRLLTDVEQSATLDQALDQVLARDFATLLDSMERRFLLRLTRELLQHGGSVHDVLQSFARSLKHFVQSREYLEQRRLNQILREAQSAAFSLKEHVKATEDIGYTLQLTSSRLRSHSQWTLYDPSLNTVDSTMSSAEPATIDLEAVGELITQSEIDFRTLKSNIRTTLEDLSMASIAQVLNNFPATQGLGSVVGYVALGSRHGVRTELRSERVDWIGADERLRSARIPLIYFLKERANELA
jgi:hypothetical protein